MNGFLVINKPPGISSAHALNLVKRLLPRGTKIGHAGTLDPLASGVLVALVGRATKLCERVMAMPKQYRSEIRLGATSETDDAEGPIVDRVVTSIPTREQVEQALKGFVGTIEQTPPAFSAMKIGGRRACDRVRDGQAVNLPSRPVRIDAIELVSYDWPILEIVIDCGRGTYVRSIARDLGESLQTGGYLSRLVRTRVGPFTVEAARTPEELSVELSIERRILPLESLDGLPPQ